MVGGKKCGKGVSDTHNIIYRAIFLDLENACTPLDGQPIGRARVLFSPSAQEGFKI